MMQSPGSRFIDVLGRTYDSQICSIARALELVGERWTLLIIRDALFAGVTRFNDHQHNLGIATNILKSRLDALLVAGIMRRQPGPGGQTEYVLTEKGRCLEPALIALTHWGDRWATTGEPPIVYEPGSWGPAEADRIIANDGGWRDPAPAEPPR